MGETPSWATWTTRRGWAWVAALVPLLVAAGLIVGLGTATRTSAETDTLPAGFGSTEAATLAASLPDDTGATAIVLWTADEGELTDDQVAALASSLGDLPDDAQAALGSPLPSDDGTAAFLPVALTGGSATAVADQVTALREALRADVPDAVSVAVTGPAAIQADLAEVFSGADVTLLATTATVVAILLVLTYRSPVLWVVPLVVVGLADRLATVLATHAMAATGLAWDESTTGILSVLVFGAGTDYALLLISRYRDELRREENRHRAMARALHRTAEAVLGSSSTVVVGVLCLLLSLTPTTRGLGLASAVGVVVAAVMVMVALPAALVLFGRWVFWPKVPHVGTPTSEETAKVWGRVGRAVARRPRAVLAAGVVVIALAASPALGLRTGLSAAEQFLDTPESISAAERLGESFPSGSSEPATVVSTDDADTVLATVQASAAVSSAQPSASGDGVTQVDAVLDAEPGSDAAGTAVETLRADLADAGLDGTYVGGSDAERIDEAAAAGRDRLVIFPLVLLLVLVALVLLLRSLVAPLLLVATVVATYGSALGLGWLLFTQVLGFSALDVSTPLFAFLFLVALGVDYNIFLITRTREEAERHGTREGVLRALSATGGVITSAGILLAAVFAVLGVLPLVVLAQLGVVIGIGVLLDTLLVRTVIVPSLVLTLGERFWWPARPGRSRQQAGSPRHLAD
ncbi:MMPL family transporter [Nocardioides bruguierae]|uniref:MMPL family transporter n=1 Tax=Nocardioides bruguierae TaxID=2945102 RepID=A0A9X2IGB0_9ACTN|nr:MMPL family transporter [Nocardioides bruguierae]MCM0620590.1 MMPL family transporter [Nocardioides bruguierae]